MMPWAFVFAADMLAGLAEREKKRARKEMVAVAWWFVVCVDVGDSARLYRWGVEVIRKA